MKKGQKIGSKIKRAERAGELQANYMGQYWYKGNRIDEEATMDGVRYRVEAYPSWDSFSTLTGAIYALDRALYR